MKVVAIRPGLKSLAGQTGQMVRGAVSLKHHVKTRPWRSAAAAVGAALALYPVET